MKKRMKRWIINITVILFLFCTVIMTGCSDSKILNGKLVETYGLINESKVKVENVQYKLCVGNFIWGILLVETLIAPIYFFGFDIYEPVTFINETPCTEERGDC